MVLPCVISLVPRASVKPNDGAVTYYAQYGRTLHVSAAAEARKHGAGDVGCDSRRAVGPIRTIRGVYMTQLNRLQRLATLSASNEWSFYLYIFLYLVFFLISETSGKQRSCQ